MELRSLGLSRKLATMTRKFNPENYMFLTRRDTEIYFEHGKLEKNGNFRLLLPCGQWVFDKSP